MSAFTVRHVLVIALSSLSLSGCASIVSGRRADISFDTYPENAHVTVSDDRGKTVASLQTPGVVTLKRQGRFFRPARYTAVITAPGYKTAQVPIGTTLNPWLLGNIVIGGVPGLVIDSVTGAAWKLNRAEVHQHLVPLEGPNHGPVFSEAELPLLDPENEVRAANHSEASGETRSVRR